MSRSIPNHDTKMGLRLCDRPATRDCESQGIYSIPTVVERFTEVTFLFPTSTHFNTTELAALFYDDIDLRIKGAREIVSGRSVGDKFPLQQRLHCQLEHALVGMIAFESKKATEIGRVCREIIDRRPLLLWRAQLHRQMQSIQTFW